ncbi:hypothetical protein LTR04_001546 [Oleoguttula sp. CCFEE 6159]|nr:hypothetical protein LTR04_001546 [Oleoguttula sp. CCFEE 6159]
MTHEPVDLQAIHDDLLAIANKAGEIILSANPASGAQDKKNSERLNSRRRGQR